MRLIDADALMKVIREHDYPLRSHFNSTDNGMFTIGVQQAVDDAPTIDAVRVVRCKDCVWFEPKHILHNDGTVTYVAEDAESVTIDVGINCQATCRRYSYIKNLFVSDSGNDYCSRGEKMDGEKGEKE